MLGRLKMDINSCIKAYSTMMDKVFTKVNHRAKPFSALNPARWEVQGRFDTDALEQAIKSIIVESGEDEEALLRAHNDPGCKMYVF
jgi:hypothetical protein